MPGARLIGARALGPDDASGGAADETSKELGYGAPIRVTLEEADGARHDLVLHVAQSDDYGHDRRSDRAAATLLAYDTFHLLPQHARAVDVGALRGDGSLVSLRDAGELYLLTEWAEGHVYADDLRRVAREGVRTPLDDARIDTLADYLVRLHAMPGTSEAAYVRSIRDLVGSGEGVAGIADGYDDETPGAPRDRIEAIERACLEWRHRLRGLGRRVRRTHGDFHPFNLLFGDGDAELVVLDTSRGSEGDPADDVAALAINLLFFGAGHRERWTDGLGAHWSRFFERYLARSGDAEVLDVIAPFFAWRALVVASPRWYPHLAAGDRDRILRFAERALAARRFDLAMGFEAMA